MNKNNYCVIMAGGIGSRFWPLSKTAHPKQFLDILGTGKTLLQQTFSRFARIITAENIYIVTNEQYKELTLEQLPQIKANQVLCEPARRNTAPCIAFANYKIAASNPNANIVVAPSDHIITNEGEFLDIIELALNTTAQKDWLITLGIKPSNPNTGYGYIQFNQHTISGMDSKVRRVKTFTEKPILEMAKSFLQSGDFLWNSGIFVWSLQAINKAFDKHLPDIDIIFKEGANQFNTPNETDFIQQAYAKCKSISIDYGVMEKAENVHVIISDFGWSDLGTWGSLYEHSHKDNKGNAVIGKNVMLYNTNNCIVNIPGEKLIVTQGIDDLIIVEADNILLISKKSDEQQIREIVNDVKLEKGDDFI